MRSLHRLVVIPLASLALAACCTTPTPAPTPPEPEPAPPDGPPVGKRAPRSDADVQVPESGFWERSEPGVWKYDLGVGMTSDVQLVIDGAGARGVARVSLPPGATGAIMESLTVMWARNAADSDEPATAASGTGVWHVQADAAGRPGPELLALPVTIDGATAAPLDDGNDGTTYALEHPLEVPAVFWLVFEETGGDPRIGAMRLIGEMAETYKDLYYLAAPDAPLGEPRNTRPYLAIRFRDLGR